MSNSRYRVESNTIHTGYFMNNPLIYHASKQGVRWDTRVPLHKSNLKNPKARITFPTLEEAVGFVRTLQMHESSPRPDGKPLPWFNEHRIVQITGGKETVIREFPVDPKLMKPDLENAP